MSVNLSHQLSSDLYNNVGLQNIPVRYFTSCVQKPMRLDWVADGLQQLFD